MATRRQFIEFLVHAGIAAAGLPKSGTAVASAPAPDVPVDGIGMLDEPTLRVLMATAEALAGMQPLRGHYEAYYRHQARHRAGYLSLYKRFADEVRSSARKAGREDFAACDLPERFRILDSIRSKPDAAREFELPVFRETLAVFEATDAWLMLGYVSWEGSPRGLDIYREPFSD